MNLYQHFKGGLYIVTSDSAVDATNSNDQGEARVAYCSIFDNRHFSREFTEFHQIVEHEGKLGPRFRVILDAADIMPEGGHP